MEIITLKAQKRDLTGRKVSVLRKQSKIPAVLYGRGFDNQNIVVEYDDFDKAFKKAGESTLVELAIDKDNSVKVLIHNIQTDALSGRYTHVDFRQVNMKEKVDAEVQIVFEGVSPAVKEQGGVFVQQIDSIHIRALPDNLMHEIIIDMSKLANLGDRIYVRDLELPDTIEILNDPSVVIAAVEAQRVEEEPVVAGGDEAEGDSEEDSSTASQQGDDKKEEEEKN